MEWCSNEMEEKLEKVELVTNSSESSLTSRTTDEGDAASKWASPWKSGRQRVVLVMQNPALLTSLSTYPSRRWPISFIGNTATPHRLSVALTMSSSRDSPYCSLQDQPEQPEQPEQPDAIQRYPAYVGGLPVYVYHRSADDSIDGVQLLRYLTVPPSQSNSIEYLNRPKSQVAVDSARYDSQDLGRDCYPDSELSSASTYSPIVVVAIDFGTTYSGYAFSFLEDPDNIHMMRKWEG